MRWLKENSFLLGLAATTILAGGALVFLMMHSMTQYRETREAYTQAVRKLHALQNRSPFPNAENFEKSRALEEQYKSELDSLRARLAIEPRKLQHRIKIRPQKFQDDLRTAVNRIAEKAGAAGVELPKGFYLGFSQYANSLPNEHAAPVLARQLGVIEKVVADLIGFKVQSIDGLYRPPLPEESATVIQETEDPQQRGRQSEAKPSGFRRQPFDLAFTAEHGKLRVAFNSLLDSDQFLIVRNLTFQNTARVGPQVFRQSSAGPVAQGEQSPGGVSNSQGRPTAPSELNVILGRELVKASMRIEIIDFPTPSEPRK